MKLEKDNYFMEIAISVAHKSTCFRRDVGAVIVKDNIVLATGYNDVPKGIKPCIDTGCTRDRLNIPSGTKHEICSALHAEQNAMICTHKRNIDIEDSTLYVTTYPCVICTKMLINSGIKRIVYSESYPDPLSEVLLREANIIVKQI